MGSKDGPISPLLRIFTWAPALTVMGIIFWLSSVPGDSLPLPDFLFSDKAAHFSAYGLLGWLIGYRRRMRTWFRRKSRNPVITGTREAAYPPHGEIGLPFDRVGTLVGILYGISDEIHQLFVPLRSASVADFIADGLGVSAGIWIQSRMSSRLARKA